MFDLFGNERLTEWRKIRDRLEKSENPFSDVLSIWSKAPFVNHFLDPTDSSDWPDPWHLILDNRYDDLAISLGLIYTLTLTDRFSNIKSEIHMSSDERNQLNFYVIFDNGIAISVSERKFISIEDLKNSSSVMIWSKNL